MGEAARGTKKPRGQLDDGTGCRQGWLSQGSQKDGFDATHVDQLEGKGSVAGFLQPVATVSLGQTEEFLSLTELDPREVAGKECLGEASDARAEFLGLGDHVIRVPTRIGDEMLRVVLVVGGAPAGFWTA